MNRRYFILYRVSPDEVAALNSCIGGLTTQKYSLDYTNLYIKTTQNYIDAHIEDISILGVEKTKSEIDVIMSSLDWQEEIEEV